MRHGLNKISQHITNLNQNNINRFIRNSFIQKTLQSKQQNFITNFTTSNNLIFKSVAFNSKPFQQKKNFHSLNHLELDKSSATTTSSYISSPPLFIQKQPFFNILRNTYGFYKNIKASDAAYEKREKHSETLKLLDKYTVEMLETKKGITKEQEDKIVCQIENESDIVGYLSDHKIYWLFLRTYMKYGSHNDIESFLIGTKPFAEKELRAQLHLLPYQCLLTFDKFFPSDFENPLLLSEVSPVEIVITKTGTIDVSKDPVNTEEMKLLVFMNHLAKNAPEFVLAAITDKLLESATKRVSPSRFKWLLELYGDALCLNTMRIDGTTPWHKIAKYDVDGTLLKIIKEAEQEGKINIEINDSIKNIDGDSVSGIAIKHKNINLVNHILDQDVGNMQGHKDSGKSNQKQQKTTKDPLPSKDYKTYMTPFKDLENWIKEDKDTIVADDGPLQEFLQSITSKTELDFHKDENYWPFLNNVMRYGGKKQVNDLLEKTRPFRFATITKQDYATTYDAAVQTFRVIFAMKIENSGNKALVNAIDKKLKTFIDHIHKEENGGALLQTLLHTSINFAHDPRFPFKGEEAFKWLLEYYKTIEFEQTASNEGAIGENIWEIIASADKDGKFLEILKPHIKPDTQQITKISQVLAICDNECLKVFLEELKCSKDADNIHDNPDSNISEVKAEQQANNSIDKDV